MLATTTLIDRREPMTVDEVYDRIHNRTLLIELGERAGEPLVGGVLFDGEPEAILDALGGLANAVTPEDLGVADRDNGFLFVNALFIELIQGGVEEISLG
jgi:hypothetical protein